jgi:DNA-directed DNA polymerase III PolC
MGADPHDLCRGVQPYITHKTYKQLSASGHQNTPGYVQDTVIHLNTHSYFSFLEGVPSPGDLARAAADQGMSALALTDHRWLSGAVEFYETCKEVDVKPILGLSLEISFPEDSIPLRSPLETGRMRFLAEDRAGWQDLCQLSSTALTSPYYPGDQPLPVQSIAESSSGLLCLTGGVNSLLNRLVASGAERSAGELLATLSDIFPGRLYIELQKHGQQDALWVARLAEMATRYNLPVVATHAVFYLAPEEEPLQRVISAMRMNQTIDTISDSDVAPPGAYFLSADEMRKKFSQYPEALKSSVEISERCQSVLPVGDLHFPEVPLPDGKNISQVLREKAYQGAKSRYPVLTGEINQRLEHELSVIEDSGYAPLFLVMEDIVAFAHEQDIPISSRGSAASSLVAHSLGITTPDPIRLNLYFERFLNPARKSPPDIDTDLCSRRRDEVIQYVYHRYGAGKAAMVCTVNRLRRRSAFREVAKACGLPSAVIKEIADQLPGRWYGPPARRLPDRQPYGDLVQRYPQYEQTFQFAEQLLGSPRHLSIHPGGIVIAPGLITDLVPVQIASKGIRITQFDLEAIERFGLVKIDLLGIRGLTVLNDVASGMAPEIPDGSESRVVRLLESIPETDPSTMETLQYGRTIGCFQIESPGMRTTLKEINARSVDDIMVALALYRPGPLTGGLKNAFVRRHRQQEPPEFLHPSLVPLLEDTYGVILYQEQVLRIAHELAGLSLSDADLLRRAMSHFDPGDQMVTLKRKFIAGAHERNHVPIDIAESVWEQMAAFAGYGFPKAHAASYAQIAWRSAWCKTHFPAQFIAAVLANWGGYYGQSIYLMEARRLGLEIRPPDVSYAEIEFSVLQFEGQPVLLMGLNQVRDLTRRTQHRILSERPYRSLNDFLTRVDPRPVEVENLIKASAMDAFGTIPAMLEQISGNSWHARQLSLFTRDKDEWDDWSIEQKAAAQHEILGVSVIAHQLELKAEQIKAAGALDTIEALSHPGDQIRVAGMRQTWRRSRSRRGDYLYFMSLEDMQGILDVVIPGEVYRRYRTEFSGRGPYIIEGFIEHDPKRLEPALHARCIQRIQ